MKSKIIYNKNGMILEVVEFTSEEEIKTHEEFHKYFSTRKQPKYFSRISDQDIFDIFKIK